MKRLALIVLLTVLPVCAPALNEFGVFAAAKATHAEYFRPGVYENAILDGAPWYVYCGDAEKCFDEETDNELYEEAEVQAKQNFYEYFHKKDPGVKVTVSGARKMYQYADGVMRYVVIGVPKSGVKVLASPVREVKTIVPKAQIPAPQSPVAVTKPEPVSAPEPAALAQVESMPVATLESPSVQPVIKEGDSLSDEEKLTIYRARLEKNPDDFNVRIRMARVFDRQGNVKRALRNYADAARMIVRDEFTAAEEKAPQLREVAMYEEQHEAGALALKHYRVLQRMAIREQTIYATQRISALLLHYR